MTLEQALKRFAIEMRLNPDDLIAYAAEDTETGWDYDAGEWPCGSLFASEGKILYALIRALRPDAVVEFGACYGCSAKHMLKAMVANKHGKLISVDPAPKILEDRFSSAEKKRWIMLRADGETVDLPVEQADLVFEDAMHSAEMTEALVRRGLALNPRIVLSHDGEHYLVGEDVRKGFRLATGKIKTIKTDDSDCGFAYWVRPE